MLVIDMMMMMMIYCRNDDGVWLKVLIWGWWGLSYWSSPFGGYLVQINRMAANQPATAAALKRFRLQLSAWVTVACHDRFYFIAALLGTRVLFHGWWQPASLHKYGIRPSAFCVSRVNTTFSPKRNFFTLVPITGNVCFSTSILEACMTSRDHPSFTVVILPFASPLHPFLRHLHRIPSLRFLRMCVQLWAGSVSTVAHSLKLYFVVEARRCSPGVFSQIGSWFEIVRMHDRIFLKWKVQHEPTKTNENCKCVEVNLLKTKCFQVGQWVDFPKAYFWHRVFGEGPSSC